MNTLRHVFVLPLVAALLSLTACMWYPAPRRDRRVDAEDLYQDECPREEAIGVWKPRDHREASEKPGDKNTAAKAKDASGEKESPGWTVSDDWRARLVWDSETRGTWWVGAFDVMPRYPGLEVVALDDLGKAPVIFQNGGKFVAWPTVFDGKTGSCGAFGDVDPRLTGPELYVAGFRGNVTQVKAHHAGAFDEVVIWRSSDQIHTLAIANLRGDGPALYAFTLLGAMVRLDPPADGSRRWSATTVMETAGRVRDAVVVPGPSGVGDDLLTVSQDGVARVVYSSRADENTVAPGGMLLSQDVYKSSQALARVTPMDSGSFALCGDDGQVVRMTLRRAEADEIGGPRYRVEQSTVFYGPEGARGIAWGRFTDAPGGRKSLAVFGYSRKVQILTENSAGKWTAETAFTDTARGHWLTTAELDSRNGTDELLLAGYSGKVVVLARPAGYGAVTHDDRPGAGPTGKPGGESSLPGKRAEKEDDSPADPKAPRAPRAVEGD